MLLRPAIFVLATVLAGDACAALVTHCVSTSAQLRTALTSVNATNDTEIRVRSGTYVTGGLRFSMSLRGSTAFEMSGGWGLNCTTQVQNPGLTLLDAAGASQVLEVLTGNDAAAPSAVYSNFTVLNGAAAQSTAAGMSVYLAQGTPHVLLDRLRVRDNHHTGGFGGGLRISNFTSGTAVLRNSLVTGNSAAHGGGVSIGSTVAGAVTVLVNNTVFGNQVSTPTFSAGGVAVTYTFPGAGSIELRNNLVVGNTAAGAPADAYADPNSAGYVGTHNAYMVAPGGKVTDAGSKIGLDPRFMGPGDYRLASDSPMIDAGAPLSAEDAASRDQLYVMRVIGEAPDIGAHESNWRLFRNSFE